MTIANKIWIIQGNDSVTQICMEERASFHSGNLINETNTSQLL